MCELQAQTLPKIVESTPLSIGKSVTIYSEVLEENRSLNIYFPENYSEKVHQSYPVIYLLDGSIDEDFLHIAGLVQFGSFSWINIVPESIVVGISNVDRKRDFTYPSQNALDQQEFPSSGKSEMFIDFIENELQPFVRSEYRTANSSTLIGQSLGGLLATEILFKRAELFDNYIIVSPSLWWDDERLLDYELSMDYSEKAVYIAVGKEGEVMERTAVEFYSKLSTIAPDSIRLFFDLLED
ncbi:MAG: alpha/beta hydrolase, partial [Flavobacteriales bacterium]|nr:alpha/beta hydrolase [Flavobacteriales bacterium]